MLIPIPPFQIVGAGFEHVQVTWLVGIGQICWHFLDPAIKKSWL